MIKVYLRHRHKHSRGGDIRDEAGGDIFLGSVLADGNGKPTLRYRGDMTGKYIDAMTFQLTDFGDGIARESSEFGPRTRM